MISVLILTLNEEQNLPGCLASLKWCDDVVVFDSFSTDRTVEIAQAAGARVVQRKFSNYGSQREAARISSAFKYPWVLALDADETPDDELVKEMLSIADANRIEPVAFRMRRKDHFMGCWVKHASLYPSWFVRFFRHKKVRYDARAVHEYPEADGTTGQMSGHLIHHSFSKGLSEWWRKHIEYSELEAGENLEALARDQIAWQGFVSFDPVRRRRALKSLSFRFPCRPLLRFLYMYFLRLGILDGVAGYHYCRLLSIYEYMIVLKMREISRRRRALPF